MNNMFGAAGICLSADYPNPNASDLSMSSDSKTPRIALDFITRSKFGSLKNMVQAFKEEMQQNVRGDFTADIKQLLKQAPYPANTYLTSPNMSSMRASV